MGWTPLFNTHSYYECYADVHFIWNIASLGVTKSLILRLAKIAKIVC